MKKNREKGFAFSADIALAVILVTSLLVFISLPTQPAPNLEERRITDQYVDDLFVALDHSGFITQELDVNGFSLNTLQQIYNHAQQLLPKSYSAYLQLKKFPVDISNCRDFQNFENCFPDENIEIVSYGTDLTNTAPFVRGRRVFIKQQPGSECTTELQPSIYPWILEEKNPLFFQSSGGANIHFDVNVSPSGNLTCDENITVSLSITADSGNRKPIDAMLVFDRSGSMSYGALLDTSDAQGVALSNNYAYVADSYSGLRVIDVNEPGLPLLTDTYNTPGTSRDVDVLGDYAFIADGTQGLRIVNVSDPYNIYSEGSETIGGDSYGVATTGNRTYVANYDSDGTDVYNLGSSSQTLYIGRNASNEYAAQSFIPSAGIISGVIVRISDTGNPSGDLLVHLRTSITGADMAVGTIPQGSTSGSYQNITATFPTPVSIIPGSTYYIVLTTPSNDSSNYYRWGASSSSTYGGGRSYQNSSTAYGDARFATLYPAGFNVIDTSSKSNPTILGVAQLDDPWRVWLDGTYAYVADGDFGFKIIDISTDNDPTITGTCYNISPCNISTGYTYDVTTMGNYAYVADGSAGLRIVDISNKSNPVLISTYNTPGTAYSVRVQNNIAYVADGSSLYLIDVSIPNNPNYITDYYTPWNYRDLEINNEWAFIAVDYGIEGLATVSLSGGSKIDQAKEAAKTFVQFEDWNPDSDQIGLVSYSSLPTLDQGLTGDFNLVTDAIDTLAANGATATGSAINDATDELNANGNENALHFQVLMSDGQTNTGENSSTAAITAANNEITIYTIGFGLDADETELQNIAAITGGAYYYAQDQNALEEIYQLIAEEIQLLSTDANLVTGIPDGILLVSDGNGLFSDGNLFFDINTQQSQPWVSTFTFNIPCSEDLACQSDLISIPSPGTFFEYIDQNGITQRIDWNVFVTSTFSFRDLNIEILSGELLGPDNADLTTIVSNAGNLDTNSVSVNFYKDNPVSENFVNSHTIPNLCGSRVPECTESTYSFIQNVPAEGELYAVVNPDNIIPECSYNNQDVIFCYSTPPTEFYTLDYWVWLDE